MYYDMTRDKNITISLQMWLIRDENKKKCCRGEEPMPTDSQCVSEAKIVKGLPP